MQNDELSYLAHINNFENLIHEIDKRLFHIKNKDCIDYQILKRTLDILKPFLNSKNKWLTVGDYNGLEANYLIAKNQIVTASDITDAFLIESNKEGLINDYSVVNVEKIHFDDNTFDYIICKEAFHHFPKAYIGLYEMFRCSKKAAIIIEPIDIISKMPFLLFLKNKLDIINPLLINKLWRNRFSFETVGNYIFKISEREIEKMAMGIGFPCIAFKRINIILNLKTDAKILKQVPVNKYHWKKILFKIGIRNILSFLHIIPYNHLCCVVFKEMPENEVLLGMKKLKYTIIKLPVNPYLNKQQSNK